MAHLGGELKQAREAAGLSLREMATRTKISATALEALERGDLSRLPGGIFGRSFVRAYAIEVGADPDAIVERFIEQLDEDEREAAERRAAMMPAITSDDRQFLARQQRALMVLRVGLVVLVVAVIALVTWRVRVFMSAGEEAPATEEVVIAPVIVPPEPADPPPPVPDPATPVIEAPMVIELDASADSWVSLTVDGAESVARLFRAGDRQRVEVTREILLDVGNAGGLALFIDGRRAKVLGRDGARVRTRITRQNVGEFLE